MQSVTTFKNGSCKLKAEIWAEIRHNLVNIFASLSLKTGELKTFLQKDEILELPRRQNASRMFSVVATTRNSASSTSHRSRSTTGKKMNSHLVLIMHSSMFNHSRSP